ncbi:hypothetical protein [Hymenobacter sp. BT491]|uniref:hypothetical protein n=1 Tax=Hymenobacter sp. BT491 TaxID=2766779 RepID=UPI0016538DF4|nr:hypothetical protein [Hymenobacter sp. BT491]MBC6992287.1 hypothetical protein [Hymenobacter sp. BT491]
MSNTSTKSTSGRAFGVTLCAIISIALALILYDYIRDWGYSHSSYESSYGVESYSRPKTAAELRAELLERERENPTEYLDTSGKYWRNLINELVVEGDVLNTATMAKFKDPEITVNWYSKTGTQIGSKTYTKYEFLRPNHSVHFKYKMYAPSEVVSVAIGVTDAKASQ